MKNNPVKEFIKGRNFSDMSHDSSIEIIGKKRIIIEQTENIKEYENDKVRVVSAKITVVVTGKDLSIDSYCDGITIIDGFIENISLTFFVAQRTKRPARE